MHYKNGREAKTGDIVSYYNVYQKIQKYGVLLKIYEGAQACSGIVSTSLRAISFAGSTIILPTLEDQWGTVASDTITLQDALHIEDYCDSLKEVKVVTDKQIPTL